MRKTVLRFRPRPTQTALYSHRRWVEIQEVEEFYYLCSENKDANQLHGYSRADLRLCFRICKKRFSHAGAHIVSNISRH